MWRIVQEEYYHLRSKAASRPIRLMKSAVKNSNPEIRFHCSLWVSGSTSTHTQTVDSLSIIHVLNNFRIFFFYHGAAVPSGSRPLHYRGFTVTLRHATVGRTPLDEQSARRRDLYLTTHNTHKRKHPCPRRNSNPQSHHASGRSPTPYAAALLQPEPTQHNSLDRLQRRKY